jgi:AcrR family transcriptional regulator
MTRRVKRTRQSASPTSFLPSSFEAAWGIRSRPGKGPKPGLSLSRIVAAAIQIASSEGLGEVSMSRVAGELGVATMSLYRYVKAKDELLALMMDAVFETPPPARTPHEGWRRAVSRWARAHLAVLRQHPWVVRIPIGGPPVLPNQLVWMDRGLGCLAATPLSERQKLSTLLLVNGFVRNEALLTSDLQSAARAAEAGALEDAFSYGRLLSGLIAADRFPSIMAVVHAGVFEGADGPDTEFDFGLERILDGIATLMPGAGRARR